MINPEDGEKKKGTRADIGCKMRLASFERRRLDGPTHLQTDGPMDGRTDLRTDGRTYERTDKPSYRDARTHLKTSL